MPQTTSHSRSWRILGRLVEMLASNTPVSSGVMSALADRVISTIMSHRSADARIGAAEVNSAFGAALQAAPEAARQAISFAGPSALAVKAAFALGQLNFAGALLGRVVERRGDEQFVAMLEHPNYRSLVRALAQSPSNGVDLAAKLDITEETVSRKLQPLREAGIAEFRREGVQLINFLSPAAIAMLGPLVPSVMRSEAAIELDDRKRQLDTSLQVAPTFSRQEPKRVSASAQALQ